MRISMVLFFGFALAACDPASDDSSTPMSDVGPGSGGMTMDTSMSQADMMVDMGSIAEGSLVVMPSAVDFGAVGVGSRGQADVVFSNPGEGDIDITAFEGLQAPFGIGRSLPLRIPAGAQRTVVVSFEPSAAGNTSQDVTIETSQDGLAATLSLSGQGESATGALENETLNFGILEPGETTSDFVVITNLASTRLTVMAVDGILPPFSIPDGQIPATGEPMDAVRFLISFAPEEEGDFEQTVTVRTNGGNFIVNLVGRSLAPGALTVHTVMPSWAPIDEAVSLQIRGGPFPEGVPSVVVGDVALEDVERRDERTVVGTLPADADAPLGPQDVRVDFDGSFGVLTGRLIRTPAVSDGRVLNADTDVSEPLGPAGNPWRLQGPLVLSETVTILPDVVIVADAEDGQDGGFIEFQAGADIGSRDGVVVFSSTRRAGWNWQGLRFSADDQPSALLNSVVEYAGINRTPRIVVSEPRLSIEGLTLQGAQGDTGIQYTPGSTVSLVRAYFDEELREAMHIQGDSIGILSETIVPSAIPIRASADLFGRRPIGAGHQWAQPFIALYGSSGTVRLSNQPAGIAYASWYDEGPSAGLSVDAETTLTIPASVDFRLRGTIEVAGTLALGADDQIMSDQGGIRVLEDGVLRLASTPDTPIVFGQTEEEWPDARQGTVRMDIHGQIEGGHFRLKRGALSLNADFGDLEGIQMDNAWAPLVIAASGNLIGLSFQSEAHGILISGAGGRLNGIVDTASEFDVRFEDPVLCAAWDLSGLRRPDNGPLNTNCP